MNMNMNVVFNAIHAISSIRGVRGDVRVEALHLAAGVAPRIGSAGWALAQAEALLAQAEANLLEAREAAAREKAARFDAEILARHAAARAAFEEAGRQAGGFCLVDTGRTGHGGHWPHWSVTPGAGGWPSLEQAEAEAQARNQRVAARWAEYIS